MFPRWAHGQIEVICGPMFSGKTEELIRRLRRARIARQRIQVFKPAVDTRHAPDAVVSHSQDRFEARLLSSSAEVLRAVDDRTDVVGVDEVQFFDAGIVAVVQELVADGLRIVAAGLDTDFRAEPFGSMPTLLAISEFVDKLQAVCHRCGGMATRTQRLVDGRPAPFSGETIQVGALDSYEARCVACYEPGPAELAVSA